MNSVKWQYRGIIHNHSASSLEGCYALRVLRERWAPNLDFAAMTEHAEKTTAEAYASYVQECEALSDEHFRFIPGLEVATESGDMLLMGCRTFVSTRDPFQVMKEAAGCLILLAHPEKGHMMPAVLEQVHGFEGWNARYMGGYVPPFDLFKHWKQAFPQRKIMTGGNDIHTVDPKRKIMTLVHSPSPREVDLLEAIKAGQFITSNGIFSVTSDGCVLYGGREVRLHVPAALLAQGYRLGWRGANICLRLGGKLLRLLGIGRQERLKLRRMIRQYI